MRIVARTNPTYKLWRYYFVSDGLRKRSMGGETVWRYSGSAHQHFTRYSVRCAHLDLFYVSVILRVWLLSNIRVFEVALFFWTISCASVANNFGVYSVWLCRLLSWVWSARQTWTWQCNTTRIIRLRKFRKPSKILKQARPDVVRVPSGFAEELFSDIRVMPIPPQNIRLSSVISGVSVIGLIFFEKVIKVPSAHFFFVGRLNPMCLEDVMTRWINLTTFLNVDLEDSWST